MAIFTRTSACIVSEDEWVQWRHLGLNLFALLASCFVAWLPTHTRLEMRLLVAMLLHYFILPLYPLAQLATAHRLC